MTVVSVPKNVWTLVTTASADTIVENLGHSEVFISRTVPTLSSFDKEKLTVTTVVSGDPVYIYSVNKDTDINYFSTLSSVPDGDKGDITVSGSGSTWTIDNNAVTLAKMADMATASVIYRKTAGTGDPEVQTIATLKADLGLTGTNSGDQTITLTGDVAGSGTASFSTSISSNAVTNAKLADVATSTIKGRVTAGTGDPEDLTGTQATTILDVFTSGLKGLAPASGGGTATYLRADATWVTPSLDSLSDATVSSATEGQVLARGPSDFRNYSHITAVYGPFFCYNVAGTATQQGVLDGLAGTFNRDPRMPRAGKVIGLQIISNDNRTAGTATARVRVNGVGFAFNSGSVQLNSTDLNRDGDLLAYNDAGCVSFSAGSDVGVEVTTAGWTPTTADIAVFMTVQFAPY